MEENVKTIRSLNPDYEYKLYDDEDCRAFLKKHFGKNYADAFDILIPGAFKCDLWRYAALYVYGGVYLDMDMIPLVPFDSLIPPEAKFVSVVDRTMNGIAGIYQAFLACEPGNPIMKISLELAFYNVASRRTGIADILSITGPGVVNVALNLYLENSYTNNEFKPGDYGEIVLYKMQPDFTYDVSGRKIFKNKFEGYSPPTNYGLTESYYKDDPRLIMKRRIYYCVLALVLFCIFGVILAYIYRRSWKGCKRKCGLG